MSYAYRWECTDTVVCGAQQNCAFCPLTCHLIICNSLIHYLTRKISCCLNLTKPIAMRPITARPIIFQLAIRYLTPGDAMSSFLFFKQIRGKKHPVLMKKMLACLRRVKSLTPSRENI